MKFGVNRRQSRVVRASKSNKVFSCGECLTYDLVGLSFRRRKKSKSVVHKYCKNVAQVACLMQSSWWTNSKNIDRRRELLLIDLKNTHTHAYTRIFKYPFFKAKHSHDAKVRCNVYYIFTGNRLSRKTRTSS